jgi:hypothetical protein
MVILPSRRKNFTSQAPSGDSDPYWNNVVFLSHFDTSGVNRTFYDVSKNPITITGATNVNLLTGTSPTTPKFGAGSINFSSTATAYASGSNDGRFSLTNQEWTVEGWYWLNGATARTLFNTSFARILGTTTTGVLTFQTSANNFTTPINILLNYNVGTGAWKHVAFQRKNTVSTPITGVYDVFINGTRVGGITNTLTHSGSAILTLGGSPGTANSHPHVLDDLRITTGVARYPTGVGASFTPPTQPFPNQ